MTLTAEIVEKREQIKGLEIEKVALVAACDDYKAKLAQAEELKASALKEVEATKAEMAKAKEAADAAMKTKDEALAVAAKEIETLTAKMALVPTVDAAAGTKAAADGSGKEPEPPVDHRKIVESMTGKERLQYYRLHREAIDAAYR